MKNKHLILIFLCTLILGLLAKYAPWFKSDHFQVDLVRVKTVDLQRLAISLPGKSELVLESSDEGWVASQDDYAIRTPDSTVAPIMAALAQIRSLKIIHSDQRDTMLLLPAQSVHVEVRLKNGHRESFEIGREIWLQKQAATYIEIDRHEGIYLIDKHMRTVFTKSIDDFRNKTVLSFSGEKLRTFHIVRPGIDTVYFQKPDTSHLWYGSTAGQLVLPGPLQQWINKLLELNNLPFAAHSDEMMSADNLAASISLGVKDLEEPILIQIFNVRSKTTPERSLGRSKAHKNLPHYIVQSSQNNYSFFAIPDTLMAHGLWSGPAIAPD